MGYYHYWGLREYAEALDEFAAAAKREPNNAEVAYVSGLVLRRPRPSGTSQSELPTRGGARPRSVENLFELASVHFFTRDYAEAERVVDRATALAPDSPNLYALRTMIYLNWEGSLEKPRRLMREALGRFDFAPVRLDPDIRRLLRSPGRRRCVPGRGGAPDAGRVQRGPAFLPLLQGDRLSPPGGDDPVAGVR